jgi:hypothetical protein
MHIPLSIITTNNIHILNINNKSIQNTQKKNDATRIKVDEQKRCVISTAINIFGVAPDKKQPPAEATAAAAAASFGVFASIICRDTIFVTGKKNPILWGA